MQAVHVKPERLHELDWFRALMVILVVYAHVSRSGMPGGVHGDVEVDDRTFTATDPSTLGVRWISLVRQYCLPLLFFVSGAASACSYKRSPGSFGKILLYSLLGVSLNGVLWLLGPQNPDCDPGTGYGRHECQGAVFDFTISPFSGKVFPIVFQMWYTLMLIVLMLFNWPLFGYLKNGSCSPALLALQVILTVSFETGLVVLDQSDITEPWLVIGLLATSEILFMAIAVLSAKRPAQVPLRFIHYGLGLVVVLQFGCIPVAPEIKTISLAFVLYILCGFNKFFQLGFVLTLARLPSHEAASPIVSMYWPMLVILRTVTSPSTNWAAAGNLTYPFYPRVLDRGDYVAGAVVLMFVVDRVGRVIKCKALPVFMGYAALLLYLLHPWMMAVLILAVRGTSLDDTGSIWIMSVALSLVLGLLMSVNWRSCCVRNKASARSGQACGSSSESDGSSQDDGSA